MRSRGATLSGGLLLLVVAAGCADDQPTTSPQPTGVSIVPATPAAPTPSQPAASASSTKAAKPTSEPSEARSERVTTALQAVAVAEGAVADSSAVEVSKDDDDGSLVWEVTVRAGENGRELRISGADGSVLSNQSDQLDQSQLGEAPAVDVRRAIEIAEKTVDGGVVTDAELAREDGQRVWDVSVDGGGGAEWELWIDASSGKVVHRERD